MSTTMLSLNNNNNKRSRGTSCRADCPGRAASGKPKKHDRLGAKDPRRRQQYRRKRQNLVYNPEEEVWHEPYMQLLRAELSRASILCDSKIELPWKDIAVTTTGSRIRPEVADAAMKPEDGKLLAMKDSTDSMKLPWNDLVIDELVASAPARGNETATCDSSLEIPWSDLIIERTVKIAVSPKEKFCPREDVEIPWDAILVPRNVIIESKTRKHASSRLPSRKGDNIRDGKCCGLTCRARIT